MRRIFLFLLPGLALGLFLLLLSCQRIRVPFVPQGTGIGLEVGDVLVTEAWFKLRVLLPGKNLQVRFFRNGSLLWQRPAAELDTLAYDSGLLPAHTYRYRAELWQNNGQVDKSQELSITTMDTTSHEFEWKVFEFPSPGGSGYFLDAAIINENDIWAVGKISDENGHHNAVHWDGNRWKLKRITVRFRNSYITPIGEGIFGFSHDNIWVTLEGAPAHWNGMNWNFYHLWDMGVLGPNDGDVTRIWGSYPDNIYFVGRGGAIVHYDGHQWRRMESGTGLDMLDIWGVKNPIDNSFMVCTLASKMFKNEGVKIYEIKKNNIEQIPFHPTPSSMRSLWSPDGLIWYVSGEGVYRTHNKDWIWKEVENLPMIYMERIRGSAANNIFVVGDFGLVLHFNGQSWKDYSAQIPSSYLFWGLDVRDDLMVAVGARSEGILIKNPVILIGRVL